MATIAHATAVGDDEITISFVDTAHRLIDNWWLILLLTLAGFGLGLLLLTMTKPYFYSSAVFLPPKNTDLNTASSGGSFLTGDDTVDIYLGLLASRTVQYDVIDRLQLMQVYKVNRYEEARNVLAAKSSFSVSKNAMITVGVQADDPKLAAAIANEYLESLYRLNGEMVASASSHRRTFFEEQLDEQKKALAVAEQALKNTEVSTGVVLPAAEAQQGLSATAQLQSQIGAAQARLAQLLVTGTEQNPDVVQARAYLRQLEGQLSQQEANASPKSHGIASNSQMPGLQLEIDQKQREVKLREGLYDSLVQQYERARLASIDPGPQLQVVETAIPPDHKAGPSRKKFALVGALTGFSLSLAFLLLTAPVRHFTRLLRRSRRERAGSRA